MFEVGLINHPIKKATPQILTLRGNKHPRFSETLDGEKEREREREKESTLRENKWVNRSVRQIHTDIWPGTRRAFAWQERLSLCAPGILFVCPVNYSRSKLSGNEVPGSCLGPSFTSKVLPSAPPPNERKRTNKSASALRRDIVSCEVNHLRGLQNALRLHTPLGTKRRLLPWLLSAASYAHRDDRHELLGTHSPC